MSKLPDGWTEERVEAERKRWGINPRFRPLATAGGAVAWGVPQAESDIDDKEAV